MKGIIRCSALLGLFACAHVACGQAPDCYWTASPDGGPITVHSDVPLELAGIDINSAGGRLTPDPRTTPSPFLFTLANTRNQVAYAIVAGRVTLDGSLELGAGVTAGPLPDDVTVQGAALNSGAGCFRYVPEPSSRVLLALAGLCVLARGRRAFIVSRGSVQYAMAGAAIRVIGCWSLAAGAELTRCDGASDSMRRKGLSRPSKGRTDEGVHPTWTAQE